MKEPAIAEEALIRRTPPHERFQGVVGGIGNVDRCAEIEVARTVVLEGRKRGVLAENIGDPAPREGLVVTEAPSDLRQDPPILPRFAGRA